MHTYKYIPDILKIYALPKYSLYMHYPNILHFTGHDIK